MRIYTKPSSRIDLFARAPAGLERLGDAPAGGPAPGGVGLRPGLFEAVVFKVEDRHALTVGRPPITTSPARRDPCLSFRPSIRGAPRCL